MSQEPQGYGVVVKDLVDYRKVPRGLAVFLPDQIMSAYVFEWARRHTGARELHEWPGWAGRKDHRTMCTGDGWRIVFGSSMFPYAQLSHQLTRIFRNIDRRTGEHTSKFTMRAWRESEAIVRKWRETT